jgi:hypothetical protein
MSTLLTIRCHVTGPDRTEVLEASTAAGCVYVCVCVWVLYVYVCGCYMRMCGCYMCMCVGVICVYMIT